MVPVSNLFRPYVCYITIASYQHEDGKKSFLSRVVRPKVKCLQFFFLATVEFMSARLQKVIKSLISEVEKDNTPKSDTRMLNSELKHVQVLHCVICKKTCTK